MVLTSPLIPYSLEIDGKWCRIIHNNQPLSAESATNWVMFHFIVRPFQTETVNKNANATNDLTPMETPENHKEPKIRGDTNEVNNEQEPTIEEMHVTALENTPSHLQENDAFQRH